MLLQEPAPDPHWRPVSPSQQRGAAAEQRALDYLLSRGWVLVDRNWRTRFGEIDLILHDGSALVFVEVRSRAGAGFGGALGSVTVAKQQRVRRAVQAWLAVRGLAASPPPLRIDVVVFEAGRGHWVRDAF